MWRARYKKNTLKSKGTFINVLKQVHELKSHWLENFTKNLDYVFEGKISASNRLNIVFMHSFLSVFFSEIYLHRANIVFFLSSHLHTVQVDVIETKTWLRYSAWSASVYPCPGAAARLSALPPFALESWYPGFQSSDQPAPHLPLPQTCFRLRRKALTSLPMGW